MKFLIMGAGGMAGHVISTYLSECGHDVLGFDRKQVSHCTTITNDVCNTSLIKEIIVNGNYDAIINCIGILNQFAEKNKAIAVYLNSYLPHLLADITKNMNTKVIHMSTDCVFSGEKGSYTEDDFPDGRTFYDRTKALGELIDDKNITMRNSIVGPDINEKGIGLLNWFMTQTEKIVKGYKNVKWTGITTLELAKAMEYAASAKVSGIYNMVYSESISKYDLLNLFNKHIMNNKYEIEPWLEPVLDKSLKRTRYELGYLIPSYEVMIIEMAHWMKQHKQYYPHYFL